MSTQLMQLSRDAISPAREFFRRAGIRRVLFGSATGFVVLFGLLVTAAVIASTQPAQGSLSPHQNVLRIAASAMGFVAVGMAIWAVTACLPSRNDRLVMRLRRWVIGEIDPLDGALQSLSDDQLRAKTDEFRRRLADSETPDDIRHEAYAVVREASRRARAHRQFTCQLIGGHVLEHTNIAEMKTGEGKTIVCYMPTYMYALQGKKIHVITTNDFLVKVGAEFAEPIFALLGLTVGYIQSDMDTIGEERKQQYACDITYGTNNEFGFDYLRDNMKHRVVDQVQGALDYAIVDEVDSILVDEARTPLIISGPARDDVSHYRVADALAQKLIQAQVRVNSETSRRIKDDALFAQLRERARNDGVMEAVLNEAVEKFKVDPFWVNDKQAEAIGHKVYFIVERDRKSAHMTELGAQFAQEEAGIGSFYEGANMNWPHLIDNALRAHQVYERDRDYVVQDGAVIIVDEFTGRLMHGRQWSEGLHQAVEARERVTVKQETQTLATITLQNFFKLYGHLAGMTGTAMTESEEFMKIYSLEVVAIPTNRPVNRPDYTDALYYGLSEKEDSVVREINDVHTAGRPGSPFVLADILAAMVKTVQDDALATKIRAVLKDANSAKEVSDDLVAAMTEVYDEAMADFPGGRPILVGTTSVEKSEKLSTMLTRRFGIVHEVLNARQVAREAEIVALAGSRHEPTAGKGRKNVGNVTISTNMAGRGTDIKLQPGVVYPRCVGDLAPHEPGIIATKCCVYCDEYDRATNCAHCFKPKIDPRFPAFGRSVCVLNSPCGLHIVGTERHEARRIDDQLCGRSGRQGDPGSSRFFLSLEDDLIRLFIGQRMVGLLNMLGFKSGAPIEDKRLTRAIRKAQKHVEERNFGIRKHLLEYDEVMDYQRREFYSLRQRVLEGTNLIDLIWQMMDEAVDDALDHYLSRGYPRECAAQWAVSVLPISVEANKLDMDTADGLIESMRDAVRDEVVQTISRSLGEYVDPSMEPSEWDVRGLVKWAERFGSKLSQNQLQRMEPQDIQDHLLESSQAMIDAADLSGAAQFVEPGYGRARLVDWLRTKFGIELAVEDIEGASSNEADDIIRRRVREDYKQRECTYPVREAMARAMQDGPLENAYVAEQILRWARFKYRVDWTVEHVQRRNPAELEKDLVELNREYLQNGRITTEVDDALAKYDGEQLAEWAKDRFGPLMADRELEDKPREQLIQIGRELMRYELTRLEQYVILRTLDTMWKDHMYEMDLLKDAIGLRGYAERDPRIEYKREGTRMFHEMMSRTRARVTDDIFKVQLVAEAPQGAQPVGQAMHAGATGAGFAGTDADHQAAMARQGEGAKPQTIRRDIPKVGRNDACPCGSGKKYKNCCGRKA